MSVFQVSRNQSFLRLYIGSHVVDHYMFISIIRLDELNQTFVARLVMRL